MVGLSRPSAQARINLWQRERSQSDPFANRMLVATDEELQSYVYNDGSDDGGDDGSDDGGGDGGAALLLGDTGSRGSGDAPSTTDSVTVYADLSDDVVELAASPDSTDLIDNVQESFSYISDGTQLHFNMCSFLTKLGTFTWASLMAYLKANPEDLAVVAEWLAVAPESVLIMGVGITIALFAVAATC